MNNVTGVYNGIIDIIKGSDELVITKLRGEMKIQNNRLEKRLEALEKQNKILLRELNEVESLYRGKEGYV